MLMHETAGVGGWQTVAVRTIDEERERENYEKAVEAMRNREYIDDVRSFCDCDVLFATCNILMIVL